MIGHTFGLYLAFAFMRSILLVFLLFLSLIVTIDLFELSREFSRIEDSSAIQMLQIALYRAPNFARNIFPFAVMFGAAAALLMLNRRLELVVARASGLSVWQFLLPFGATAVALGLISSLIYNPLSLAGIEASRAIEGAVFGKVEGNFSNKSNNFWLRVNQRRGDVIVRARVAEQGGQKLSAVSVYQFNTEGTVAQRIDAKTAEFQTVRRGQNHYILRDAVRSIPGQQSVREAEFELPVDISARSLVASQTRAEDVSFWRLLGRAQQAEQAGKNPLPFITQFHSLLAQPLLFVAMMLLAATVSLRFARFGQDAKAIAAGIGAGFVLYVCSRMVITFGSNGLVDPFIAAWSPAIVGTLISATVLLHQEDG
ncbi:MAG: LPS export ABC transporter permease LptG [Pseudomonadota bacterium]